MTGRNDPIMLASAGPKDHRREQSPYEHSLNDCPKCGRLNTSGEGPICKECSRSLDREDPPFFDTLIVLQVILMISSFMVAMERTGSQGPFVMDLSSFEDHVILLLSLALLMLVLIAVHKRTQVLSLENLRCCAELVFPLSTAWSIVTFFTSEGKAIVILCSISMMAVSLLLGALSIRRTSGKGWTLLSISMLGALIFEVGMASSLGRLSISDGIWILDGPILMLMGGSVFLTSYFWTYRNMSIGPKAGVPTVLTILSMTSSTLLLLAVLMIDSTIYLTINALGNSLFLLCLALLSLAGKRWMGHLMARTDREMEAFFDRGVELMGKGELFYALQQLDLSIRRNPVDGFGRSKGTNNVLFEIEGAAHVEQFTFEPSLTEQAINDKGMMYASMGRFSDSQRQFMEATRNEPQYLEPYWNLLTMYFADPGKRQEGKRYMEMFLTSKSFYLKRWLRKGVQNDHAKWMYRCFELYDHSLRKRAVLLERIASEGDVWAYYRLVG